jgi:D-serine deaminase-like pyridoxal phosphate-dependent protein
VRLCNERGIEVEVVSGGGTPKMWEFPKHHVFTEYRVGTYLFNDRIVAASGAATLDDCASSVLVSVVSVSGPTWVTVDGGTKTFSSDQYGQSGFGAVLGNPQCELVRCSEEHGVLQEAGAKPNFVIGQKLRIIPNHACIVSNLHDVAYAVRGDEVVAEWRIAARGKLQ